MTIKPLKPRITNLHRKGIYVIQLFMIKLKLPYDPWTKGFNCLLYKSNIIITLLLKKIKR
jgi:hypothetical protein